MHKEANTFNISFLELFQFSDSSMHNHGNSKDKALTSKARSASNKNPVHAPDTGQGEEQEFDPYDSRITHYAYVFRTIVQFCIGGMLIATLMLKGIFEILQTWEFPHVWGQAELLSHNFMSHLLAIDTFSYIGKALGISAGVDLGYMLFTDGPDEALTPLMLGISSAAFLTISEHPEQNWGVGIYVFCILVLMFCMKKYKDWKLDETDRKKPKTRT